MLFLYGPPGAGKSSAGALLAQALALPFVDLDSLITIMAGKTIPEIFEAEGEAGFRARERAALTATTAEHAARGAVVSLGGGALLDEANRRTAEDAGQVVLVNASPEILEARTAASRGGRPLLHKQTIKALVEERAGHYTSFPCRVDSSTRTAAETAWAVQKAAGRYFVSGMGAGYPVLIRSGSLDELGSRLANLGRRSAWGIVSDENVWGLYGARITQSLEQAGLDFHSFILPAGEAQKSSARLEMLWGDFLAAGLDRGSAVAAVGGGVIGDLAGFAAATFMRGIPWAAVPTTLLAMVDASMGGKTGINLAQGKNLAGAFHPPLGVYSDPEVLATLPPEELRSGMAEVIKSGVIGDAALFRLCGQGWPQEAAARHTLVSRAAAVKIEIIQQDPEERGLRARLNFGHTIGHAVEKLSNYSLRHGEAVAIGMALEGRIAERLALAETGLSEKIAAVLKKFDLPVEAPEGIDRAEILGKIKLDKKKSGGRAHFALPREIGQVDHGIAVDDLETVLKDIMEG